MSAPQKFIAIGDIHGCITTLEALIKRLTDSEHADRTFIFVGDYTDRGPSSKEVLNFLIQFSKQYQCIFIRGNHDQMMLNAIENGDCRMWLFNGGESTLKSYNASSGKFNPPDDHIQFLHNTKYYFESDLYLFVHGGIDPMLTVRENLEMNEPDKFMWMRDHIQTAYNHWEKTVVFGHTPLQSPLQENKMIGIDTGCVYKKRGFGTLSAVALPETKFYQQKCLDL